MADHHEKALEHLAVADELSRLSHGEDARIPHELAAAGVRALLSVAEQLAPTIVTEEHHHGLPEQKIMPCGDEKAYPNGSAGLCMAAYVHRPGGTTEFCHFPHMHTGPHSWDDSLGRID